MTFAGALNITTMRRDAPLSIPEDALLDPESEQPTGSARPVCLTLARKAASRLSLHSGPAIREILSCHGDPTRLLVRGLVDNA